ncbi:MAG: hypothetical protein LBQ19_03775 [Synergistaceae bacterium]|nr:hypothetical protein [Synergistaceae bacterium]
MEIQGGIDMSVLNVGNANSLFQQARDNEARKPRKPSKSEQEKAMELFGKALRDCDKASEQMMDDHIENVAKSAKERAEYHKRKAVLDKIRISADERKMINEQIILNRINQRSLLEEARADDENKRELLKR